MKRAARGLVALLGLAWVHTPPARAQEGGVPDEAIDAIRRLDTIGSLDQGRIRDWARGQVDRLSAGLKPEDRQALRGNGLKALRKTFKDQWKNPANTAAFRAQLATQVGTIAQAEFANASPDPTLHSALAGVLLDFGQIETLPALVAGLKSPTATARLLCARGIENLRGVIGADKEKFELTLPALRDAAAAETSAVVLGRLYEAMAYANQIGPVFDAYLVVFDKRLARRRESARNGVGAELPAFEWFRSKAVLNGLSPDQRTELVRRLAVFLRMDAEAYGDAELAPPKDEKSPDLAFTVRDGLERSLDAVEDILATIPIENGGKIRDELAGGGFESRAGVLREAAKWVGDAKANSRGVLNDAPWNVPTGAP